MELTLPPLVDPEDVAQFGTSGSVEAEDAALVISALARSHMRQTITIVEHDLASLAGTRERRLVPGERPIRAVHAVALDGEPIHDYRWLRSGSLFRPGGWGDTDREVTIDYDHGYAVVPDDLRAACCTAAGRLLDNPHALSRLEVASEITMAYAMPVGFTVAELTVLNRYRRRTLP